MSSHHAFKITVLVKRKPELSEDEFHNYWAEKHPPVVNKWLAKHGVIKYVQYHTPSKYRGQTEEMWPGLGVDLVADYDGHAEFTVPSIEALKNAFADPFYKSHVQPDELKLFDPVRSYATFGYTRIYIDANKVLSQ
ncbi:hypothetical protein NUW58_g3105 [Xylaria curta]|uniref:Uncharacterized protein n=1 Tax=Xylaria curta TaxID=42375 RepID=A0ACC1PDQ0_9PEZI|nr:hypothetical protein NUW58_g3105 [Xylaria curta]